jgi:hypothetical protein
LSCDSSVVVLALPSLSKCRCTAAEEVGDAGDEVVEAEGEVMVVDEVRKTSKTPS